MRILSLTILSLGVAFGQTSPPPYLKGCPDTSEIKALLDLGKFQQIVSEVDAFRTRFRIMPKPCFAAVNLYYGLAQFTLQDTLAGRISWETLLANEPKLEIFKLNLPLPFHWRFDEIKLRLFKEGAIRNAFSPDYIPPTFPRPSDGPDLAKLRTTFHNARLDGYAGDMENSKVEIREYLALCDRRKTMPDPSFLLAKGELITRAHSLDRGLMLQASLAVEAGLELNKRQRSKIVDSLLLMDWGERILERLAGRKKAQAAR